MVHMHMVIQETVSFRQKQPVSYTDKAIYNQILTAEDVLLFAEINSAFSFDFITIEIINRSR